MRHLSFQPSFTLKGRKFEGLRGFSGKPFHPPLTDIPIAAYLFAAVFDVISRVGHAHAWAHDFYRAASFTLIGGFAVSVLTALTGYMDWRTSEAGTQARRTANAHAWTMITVTLIVLADVVIRVFSKWGAPYTPASVLVLTVVAAGLVSMGAALGGTLVFDYGYSVENSGDSPVWHRNEDDVLPSNKIA
jgi:uncharacterized membrane protein